MRSNEPECLTTRRCIYRLHAQFAHAVKTEKKVRNVLADIAAKADAPVRRISQILSSFWDMTQEASMI